jgi:hypothetical protein
MRNIPALVLLAIAAVMVLLARSTGPKPGRIWIDQSFAREIATIPIGRELTSDEEQRYGELIWSHEEELRYLCRTGEPSAVRAVTRLIAIGGPPGACACHLRDFDVDLCARGPIPEFWAELASLPTIGQVNVILTLDQNPYTEEDCSQYWGTDRDQFLQRHPAAVAVYRNALAASDDPAPTEEE